jgi:hypothetical protein
MGIKPRLLMHTTILLQSLSIISVTSQGSHKVDTNINHLKRRKITQLGITQSPRKPPNSLAAEIPCGRLLSQKNNFTTLLICMVKFVENFNRVNLHILQAFASPLSF